MSEAEEVRPVDLGYGVMVEYMRWRGHDKAGLIRTHPAPGGGQCESSAMFDLPGVREAFPNAAVWQVEQWEPLTLSPSLLCRACGHHGWIRDGRWVPA